MSWKSILFSEGRCLPFMPNMLAYRLNVVEGVLRGICKCQCLPALYSWYLVLTNIYYIFRVIHLSKRRDRWVHHIVVRGSSTTFSLFMSRLIISYLKNDDEIYPIIDTMAK